MSIKKSASLLALAIFALSYNVSLAATPDVISAKINTLDAKHNQAEVVWEKMNDFLDKADEHGVDISDVESEYNEAKSSHTALLESIDETKEVLEHAKEVGTPVAKEEVKSAMQNLKTAFTEWKSDMKALLDQVKEVKEAATPAEAAV